MIRNDFSDALRPVFPEWLDAASFGSAAAIAGIGSDLALARTRFESLDPSFLERFQVSNAVLMGIGKTQLAELGTPLKLPDYGVLDAMKSAMADIGARDAELWRAVSGYHIASQLAVSRIEEAFAVHEHWASLNALKNLTAFTSAYDHLVGDLARSATIPELLLQKLPAELFGHTALLDLFRYEPDLEETEEAREAYVDESRREFRLLVEQRHPELREHVEAADQARAVRGPGWAATFCPGSPPTHRARV